MRPYLRKLFLSLWSLALLIYPLSFRGFAAQGQAPAQISQTYTIDRLTDANPGAGGQGTGLMGDLRYALTQAQTGDHITFSVTGTINLSSFLPVLTRNISIDGPGANILTVDGVGGSVLAIGSGATVVISGLTITGGAGNGGGIFNAGTLTLNRVTVSGNQAGDPTNGGGTGAGIWNYSSGVLTINSSTVSGNRALGNSSYNPGRGGGIANYGTLTLNNSTVSGNSVSEGSGAGISNTLTTSILQLNNSTISGNAATGVTGLGGGLYNLGALNISNTILAGNNNQDVNGAIASQGHNLIGDTSGGSGFRPDLGDLLNVNPLLGPLQNNGGPTSTRALLPGSPAVNAGDDAKCPVIDQRGALRPQGGHCDIGSYESGDMSIAFYKIGPNDGATNQPTSLTLSWGAMSGATAYEYCLDAMINDACNSSWTNNGASTSISLTGLKFVTPYEWHVRAIHSGGIKYSNGSAPAFWSFTTAAKTLHPAWTGGASITSDKNVVAVGRPHISSEIASYAGFASGSLTAYVPMLFKAAFGSYDSALYVQNVHASNTASITIKFYDSNGVLSCTKTDTITALSSKGYWLPSATCTSGSLPVGWMGDAVVTADQPVVTVGRLHVGGEIMTYDGFASGSLATYIPMMFNGAFDGSYNAAFYLQNTHASSAASITIKYYDSNGVLSCTKADTLAPLASKGYWVPTATCDTGNLPGGWIGGVVVTSNQPILAVGRPHIGPQITTYNGFPAGSLTSYVPMLFKGAFGSYDSAFYVQNVHASNSASITIKYYNNAGSLNCTKTETIAPLAAKGYWVPGATCDSGSLPAGWIGGVVVTSNQPIVAVARLHLDSQVATYNGFPAGSPKAYLPMLFKGAFDGSYNAAFYIQNTEGSTANVTIKFYDTSGTLSCTHTDSIPARAILGYWVPDVICSP